MTSVLLTFECMGLNLVLTGVETLVCSIIRRTASSGLVVGYCKEFFKQFKTFPFILEWKNKTQC